MIGGEIAGRPMFDPEPKTLQKLAPHVERVLIVDPYSVSADLMASLMRNIGARRVDVLEKTHEALRSADALNPQLVLTELSGAGIDGVEFTRALRRSTMGCRKAPVIVVSAESTAERIKAARDAGAHEFLKKPFSAGDLFRRVENVMLKPRRWVEAVIYVGPDRRRFNSGQYKGPRKRRADGAGPAPTPAERVQDALKVLRSALLQAHQDPAQAERAIAAQIEELTTIALRAGDPRLVHAVADLDAYLAALPRGATPMTALTPAFAELSSAAADAGEALDSEAV
jgi:two-component system, response regulator PdtaR